MRPGLLSICLLLAGALDAQVLINEVQATRMPGGDGTGPDGDWVELFNAGNRPVDLEGFILAMGMRTVRIGPGIMIQPGRHRVLWCDARPAPDHVGLKLPRKGATLLLVAPDGARVLDVFRWPELPPGVSMGRSPDGARAWGFFGEPSPDGPNRGASARLLPPPGIQEEDGRLALTAAPGAAIRFTTDGSDPRPGSTLYAGPLLLPPGTPVRARAFAADAVPGPCAVHAVSLPDTAWALVLAPEDLMGRNGMADTLYGNQARKGRDWQRQAWLQQGGRVLPVGMAISGSGSRSLPKRNFKLLVRDRFNAEAPVSLADGARWNEVILRADATRDAFLHNMFMEEVARRSGSRVDVQPSEPVPLYINGGFQGLYRAMPAKGGEWLRSLHGGGDVEVIEGPGATAIKGRNKHYLRSIGALWAGRPMDSLEKRMDIGSLVELACFDLWTGRADHEMNVRAWRPRTPAGRWRWVLYDMDLWAPAEDRTVQRMCGAPVPETPFLPRLLADAALRDRLLARLAALCATTLSPDRAAPLADSLYVRNRAGMQRDHERWAGRMPVPRPEESRAALLGHINRRQGPLFDQLAEYTGRPLYTVTVQVEPPLGGAVEVEQLFLTAAKRGVQAFADVPLHFRAGAGEGMEFVGWKGTDQEGDGITVRPRRDMRITAVFRPVALSRQGGL